MLLGLSLKPAEVGGRPPDYVPSRVFAESSRDPGQRLGRDPLDVVAFKCLRRGSRYSERRLASRSQSSCQALRLSLMPRRGSQGRPSPSRRSPRSAVPSFTARCPSAAPARMAWCSHSTDFWRAIFVCRVLHARASLLASSAHSPSWLRLYWHRTPAMPRHPMCSRMMVQSPLPFSP